MPMQPLQTRSSLSAVSETGQHPPASINSQLHLYSSRGHCFDSNAHIQDGSMLEVTNGYTSHLRRTTSGDAISSFQSSSGFNETKNTPIRNLFNPSTHAARPTSNVFAHTHSTTEQIQTPGQSQTFIESPRSETTHYYAPAHYRQHLIIPDPATVGISHRSDGHQVELAEGRPIPQGDFSPHSHANIGDTSLPAHVASVKPLSASDCRGSHIHPSSAATYPPQRIPCSWSTCRVLLDDVSIGGFRRHLLAFHKAEAVSEFKK
ncbi:uncharacterized protein FIBRA_08210 [Fibroporia radiculosa]|uniref:Uncharacterized protein n=1 Tax=Fibroporia radiculosa TaxID=599839 RepID=J4H519_9APHY|nr:uncharacterized protein FIBRA_08210 [Fibroporia radiculosa]CCM05969.1 predicted protein [Fibroporia radiculosa]